MKNVSYTWRFFWQNDQIDLHLFGQVEDRTWHPSPVPENFAIMMRGLGAQGIESRARQGNLSRHARRGELSTLSEPAVSVPKVRPRRRSGKLDRPALRPAEALLFPRGDSSPGLGDYRNHRALR